MTWWAPEAPDMPRRRRTRVGVFATALGSIVVMFALIAPVDGPPPTTAVARTGATMTFQSTEALQSQCGPVYTYPSTLLPAVTAMTTSDPRAARLNYGFVTIVPIFGPMGPTPAPLGNRFLTPADPQPDRGSVLRSMWDGLMVVYYDSQATEADLVALRAMSARPDLDLLVLPWLANVPLPEGRHFGFAVWGSTQTCHEFGTFVLEQFREAHPRTDRPLPRHLDDDPGLRAQVERCTPAAYCRVAVLQ